MASEMNMLLEKATSALLLEVDITNTLQIVDLIRQNDVSAKIAVQSIFNRLKDKNPNVIIMTLQVLESVVKNCGESIHEEVCSRGSCECMEELIRGNTNEEVRSAACYLLGSWCSAFKGQPKMQAVQDLANILRAKGHQVPTSSEAAALYSADAAPDWADATCCHRCRSNFTMLKRKHHCRACGQVFCHECSSKNSNIPKFGIEKEVRVCETCYVEINSPNQGKSKGKEESTTSPAKKTSTGSGTSGSSKTAGGAGGKTEAELQEEEELQLALALSKSEAENKEKEKLRVTSSLLSGAGWRNNNSNNNNSSSNGVVGVSAPPHSPSPPPLAVGSAPNAGGEEGELAKYLNRSYWEQQQQQQQQQQNPISNSSSITKTTLSSVLKNRTEGAEDQLAIVGGGMDAGGGIGGPLPIRAASPPQLSGLAKATETLQMNNDNEMGSFVDMFHTQLEIFVNRMKSNQSRGRPIANDTSVQSLFVNITAMHGQLLQYLQQQEARRVWYEQLQDKLSQTRDARAALEALREEHRERERREREEQHRIRQMQMMQKLEVMRKKKQEYLEYQRQLAVHRMAQTERQLMQHQQPNIAVPGQQVAGIPGQQQQPGMPGQPPAGFYGPSAGPMGGVMEQSPQQPQMPGAGGYPGMVGGYHDGSQPPPYIPYMPAHPQHQPDDVIMSDAPLNPTIAGVNNGSVGGTGHPFPAPPQADPSMMPQQQQQQQQQPPMQQPQQQRPMQQPPQQPPPMQQPQQQPPPMQQPQQQPPPMQQPQQQPPPMQQPQQPPPMQQQQQPLPQQAPPMQQPQQPPSEEQQQAELISFD